MMSTRAKGRAQQRPRRQQMLSQVKCRASVHRQLLYSLYWPITVLLLVGRASYRDAARYTAQGHGIGSLSASSLSLRPFSLCVLSRVSWHPRVSRRLLSLGVLSLVLSPSCVSSVSSFLHSRRRHGGCTRKSLLHASSAINCSQFGGKGISSCFTNASKKQERSSLCERSPLCALSRRLCHSRTRPLSLSASFARDTSARDTSAYGYFF
jgi:hypothetical protein